MRLALRVVFNRVALFDLGFGCTAAQGNEQCENRWPSCSHERTENQLRIPPSNIVSPKHRWSHRRAGRLRGVAWRGSIGQICVFPRLPRPNFREDQGARDCYKYLILVVTPAGMLAGRKIKQLNWLTASTGAAEPKRLFPALANHVPKRKARERANAPGPRRISFEHETITKACIGGQRRSGRHPRRTRSSAGRAACSGHAVAPSNQYFRLDWHRSSAKADRLRQRPDVA